MPIVLPEKPVEPSRIDPKIMVLYGPPKVGKTQLLTELPGCLILDGEEGAEIYRTMRISIRSARDIREVKSLIIKKGEENIKAGKKGDDIFPYRYIALDTIDNVEEFAVTSATIKYKQSVIGKTFEGESVLDLPKGGGWYHIREEVKDLVKAVASVCRHLIIISHLREKSLDKGGMEVLSHDISLSGKLSEIVCAMADVIGYLYRKPGSAPDQPDKILVSFRTNGKTTMGARQQHLRGQTFEFDWGRIFTEDPALQKKEEAVTA